jgi:hypothetical protein
MSLTDAEKQALLWPIKAKGEVNRLKPLGDPAIEKFYHDSMEQGRFLESSIADANNLLLQKKILLNEYVISYTHMNNLAVDGQLGRIGRVPKYIADSISILQTAQRLQQELVSLVNAINGNITMLLAIEQSMLGMVNTALNSIANLLNNICNWGIPALPSIPNLFPDQLWNWNGFLFSPLALFATLKSSTTFNFNFTFSQCSFGPTAPSALFTTNPLSTQSYSGLVYGSANYFVPPFSGSVVSSSQDQTNAAFIASMQANTTDPVFQTTFNPLQNMWGAMPDPHYIISNWQPSATMLDNYIVSIVPALRGNTVFVGALDYNAPNIALRDLQLRKDLIHFVNLQNIVASNFDPLLTAAWLIYLNLDRQGRGGVWIPNFEAVYQQYIQPSVSIVTTIATPWNNVLGQPNFFWMSTWNSTTVYAINDVVTYSGAIWLAIAANTDVVPGTDATMWEPAPANTIYSNVPQIPLLQTFASLTPNNLNHLLWQLSYIEASLLGYTRNPQWDSYQDNSYLSGATGTDLDYQSTAISTSVTTLTLGVGSAEFPVPITFPTSFQKTMNVVIELASADIQADTAYLSPRLANRYTYNQFAQASQVDRFSQFWRDFATNLHAFLAQDPYLVQQAATYPEILNGAVNPLGDPTAYNSLLQDVASRSRTWTPGTPLLTIPVQPISIPPSSFQPDLNNNGWINSMDFNPVAFLARPDIQALPIPVQIAMLRTNLSYAGINVWKNNMQASIAQGLATANALLQATQQIGFHVSVYTTLTPVPPGINAQVNFDALQLPQDFDYTGNVTTVSPGLFTIQSAGTYSGVGTFVWNVPSTGTYTITVTQNGTPIATASSTASTGFGFGYNFGSGFGGGNTAVGTITTNITFNQAFNAGDVVKVLASTNLVGGTATIEPGSTFSMIQSQVSPVSVGNNTVSTQGRVRNYNLDVPVWFIPPVPALTAVGIDSKGNATPIDPFVPAISSIAITGTPGAYTVVATVNANNFAVGNLIVFSGVGTADFLTGITATVTARTGISVTAILNSSLVIPSWALPLPYGIGSPPASDTGSILYAINSSGAVAAPNPDGVTLTSGSQGQSVTVTTYYGEQYFLAPVTALDQIMVGGLLYIGPNGRLTQDYASLTTGVGSPPTIPVGWIICIGRVTAYDATTQTMTFIYEPHVPTRFSSMI